MSVENQDNVEQTHEISNPTTPLCMLYGYSFDRCIDDEATPKPNEPHSTHNHEYQPVTTDDKDGDCVSDEEMKALISGDTEGDNDSKEKELVVATAEQIEIPIRENDIVIIDSPQATANVTKLSCDDHEDESKASTKDEDDEATPKPNEPRSTHDSIHNNESSDSLLCDKYGDFVEGMTDEEMKPSISGDTVSNNESKEKELVVAKAEQIEISVQEKDELDPDPTTNGKSCFERIPNVITHFGKYFYVLLLIVTISLVGILIGFNKDRISGSVVGLACANMIFAAVLMPFITVLLLKMWTTKTWWIVFFIIYLSLIVDVFAMGTYIEEILIALWLYGVLKIVLIYQAFHFARNDGKHFIPAIISEFISVQFIRKDTKLYQLIFLFMIVLLIQMVIMSLGCMAFIINDTVSLALYFIALVLFLWVINTFRHFGTYMTARMLSYYLSRTYRSVREDNPELIILTQVFRDTLDKFTTIVIGSLLITTTPVTYFLTNLMTGIRLVTAGLVLCCIPCVDDDYDDTNNRCSCIASLIAALIVIASALTNGIAWLVRKISKWTLRVTSKQILIQSGFENITFIGAIKRQQKALKESKDTFQSDMLFLDNCMLSTITHLCILVSSIGALLTYMIEPSAAIICWIAGYAACRTTVEMIDVILQFFLIAWFVEPTIIYENKVLFVDFKCRMYETLRTLQPNEKDEVIEQQILELVAEYEEITGLQKTTDPTHISNVQHNKVQMNAIQETNVAVDGDGTVVAVQRNQLQTVIVQKETADTKVQVGAIQGMHAAMDGDGTVLAVERKEALIMQKETDDTKIQVNAIQETNVAVNGDGTVIAVDRKEAVIAQKERDDTNVQVNTIQERNVAMDGRVVAVERNEAVIVKKETDDMDIIQDKMQNHNALAIR